MGEVVVIPFVFIAIIGISAILFGGWVLVCVFKGISHVVGMMFCAANAVTKGVDTHSDGVCPSCHQANPTSARFCRRCGRPMHGASSKMGWNC